MRETPYIKDVLDQPQALRFCLENTKNITAILASIPGFDTYKRIILTGMGASLYALYPAYLELVRLGGSIFWIPASELLFDVYELITKETLIVVVSQSGKSAEVIALFDRIKQDGTKPVVLAFSNDIGSPLALNADALVPLNAGSENTVSAKTYMNSLALTGLMARTKSSGGPEKFIEDCYSFSQTLEKYFSTWEARVDTLKATIGLPKKMYLTGRGTSLSAALNGALITKEASKYAPCGSSPADFRHGPFELVDKDFTAIVFAGYGKHLELNINIAKDVIAYGGKCFMVSSEPVTDIPHIQMPTCAQSTIPLAEIASVQLLTIALAELNGFLPGEFRNSGKVTTIL